MNGVTGMIKRLLVTAAESQKLDILKQPYVYEILICVKLQDFLILDSPLW